MYEFELEEKANKTKQRIFILIYVILSIAFIILGVAKKLQEIKSIELEQAKQQDRCTFCLEEPLNIPLGTNEPTTTVTQTPTVEEQVDTSGLEVKVKSSKCIGSEDSTTVTATIENTKDTPLTLQSVGFVLPKGFKYIADSALINNDIVTLSNLDIQDYQGSTLVKITIPTELATLKKNEKLSVTIKTNAGGVKDDNYQITTLVQVENAMPITKDQPIEVSEKCAVSSSGTTVTNTPTPTPTETPTPTPTPTEEEFAEDTVTEEPVYTPTPTPVPTPPDTGIVETLSIFATVLGIGMLIFGLRVYKGYYTSKFALALGKLYYSLDSKLIELKLKKEPNKYLEYKINQKAGERAKHENYLTKSNKKNYNTRNSKGSSPVVGE